MFDKFWLLIIIIIIRIIRIIIIIIINKASQINSERVRTGSVF